MTIILNGSGTIDHDGNTATMPAADGTFGVITADTTWTPVVTSNTGTITTVGAVTGAYIKIGRMVVAQCEVTITTNGTGGGYIKIAGLPVANGLVSASGYGYESINTGKGLAVALTPSASLMIVTFYDATYPGANGAKFWVTITYFAAS